MTAGGDRQAGLQSRFEPRSHRWRKPACRNAQNGLLFSCGRRMRCPRKHMGCPRQYHCCPHLCHELLNEATLFKKKNIYQTYGFTLWGLCGISKDIRLDFFRCVSTHFGPSVQCLLTARNHPKQHLRKGCSRMSVPSPTNRVRTTRIQQS